MLNQILTNINEAMYGWLLIVVLITGGLFFTIKLRFAQIRTLPKQLRCVTERPKAGTSSFQALMVSTASRVGTGNIIGVSTAICLGGFGAVFWMWVIAILGGAAAFAESTLAQIFKKRSQNGSYGGPAYYIEACFGSRVPGVIFSVLLILTYGVGFNMLTSYNLCSTFTIYEFASGRFTPWIIGFVVAVTVGYCLLGGGKRIIQITEYVVPVMGILYILVALFIVVINAGLLPGIFRRIFREAFDFKAIFGGFGSSCVMYGIKRGLFSNEAGVGSAPNAAASADVSHPAKQGLVQVLSVFIDTLLICSATAFMCLCSGIEPTPQLSGAPYVQLALRNALGQFGPIFITVSMALFAFTTLLGNLFYVDKGILYLLKRLPGKNAQICINILSALIVWGGAVLSSDLLWNLADITMGLMALINVPVILILSKYAIGALKDFEAKGKGQTFRAEDIGLREKLDYWQ